MKLTDPPDPETEALRKALCLIAEHGNSFAMQAPAQKWMDDKSAGDDDDDDGESWKKN